MPKFKICEPPSFLEGRTDYLIYCYDVGEIGGYRYNPSDPDSSALEVSYNGKWSRVGTKRTYNLYWEGYHFPVCNLEPTCHLNAKNYSGRYAQVFREANITANRHNTRRADGSYHSDYCAFVSDPRILSAGNLYATLLWSFPTKSKEIGISDKDEYVKYVMSFLDYIPTISEAYNWLRAAGYATFPYEHGQNYFDSQSKHIHKESGREYPVLTSWDIPDTVD